MLSEQNIAKTHIASCKCGQIHFSGGKKVNPVGSITSPRCNTEMKKWLGIHTISHQYTPFTIIRQMRRQCPRALNILNYSQRKTWLIKIHLFVCQAQSAKCLGWDGCCSFTLISTRVIRLSEGMRTAAHSALDKLVHPLLMVCLFLTKNNRRHLSVFVQCKEFYGHSAKTLPHQAKHFRVEPTLVVEKSSSGE